MPATPGKSITKTNIVKINDLFLSLVTDLSANGFTKVFPTQAFDPTTHDKVVLEATTTIDPLAGPTAQPWRLCIKKRKNTAPGASTIYDLSGTTIKEQDHRNDLDVIVGTPATIQNDGTLTNEAIISWDGSGSTAPKFQGVDLVKNTGIFKTTGILGQDRFLNGDYTQTEYTAPTNLRDSVFVTRSEYQDSSEESSPMSYKLTTSPRGVMLTIWEPSRSSEGNRTSMFCIQRLVDNSTGPGSAGDTVINTIKTPLHCVYLLNGKFYRRIVRESDIVVPSAIISADTTGSNTSAVINNNSVISITEDNNYIITFPSGFTSQRYAYYGEMDLLAYTDARILAENAQIQFTAYGETTARKYMSMTATGANDTKVRILQLVDGGGTVLTS